MAYVPRRRSPPLGPRPVSPHLYRPGRRPLRTASSPVAEPSCCASFAAFARTLNDADEPPRIRIRVGDVLTATPPACLASIVTVRSRVETFRIVSVRTTDGRFPFTVPKDTVAGS